jgi:HopJ type III effector protein
MTLSTFLQKTNQGEAVSFDETMTTIAAYYHYQPTEFSNGLSDDILINPVGTNEGSCKIFAFAKLHQLGPQQTLNLFGDYYLDVLANPNGTGHPNIRNFMQYGWQGIQLKGKALRPKSINTSS